MKQRIVFRIVFLGLVSLFFIGCGRDSGDSVGGLSLESQLSKSQEVWEQMKVESGEKYSYEVFFRSWTGRGSKTTVRVSDGSVYEVSEESFDGDDQVLESSTKSGEELSQDAYASSMNTVSEIHQICKDEILTLDKETFDIFVEFDDQGLLTHCQAVREGCQDDCVFGPSIRNLQFLK